MSLSRFLHRTAPVLALLVGLADPLAAQNILFTELSGEYRAVRQAHDNSPIVEVDGKMVMANGGHYTLKKTEEYLPVFVEVLNLQVKARHQEAMGSSLNREFIVEAKLETRYNLDDVFLVLELNSEGVGKSLFLQNVGHLEPQEVRSISALVPLAFDLGRGKYVLHLFAGGREVLQSKIPSARCDAVLDRMTAKRIAGVQEAAAQPFIGPAPEYPRKLLKARVTGQVIISMRIGANGRVYDPTVKSATDPEFGKTALEVVRLWRFLPRVQGGRAIEARVDLPFDFAPPEKKT